MANATPAKEPTPILAARDIDNDSKVLIVSFVWELLFNDNNILGMFSWLNFNFIVK